MKTHLTSIAEHSDYLSASTYSGSERWELHRKRVRFGKQPLELWMFVACKLVDGVWVVVSDMSEFPCIDVEYQQAKERCLFEGFDYDKMGFAYLTTQTGVGFDEEYMQDKTIECLVKYNLELAPTAQKQIGCDH